MQVRTKAITVTSTEINAFNSVADIVKFLGALGLCRHAKNKQGLVIAKDIRLRCTVLSLLWIAYTSHAVVLRFYWSFWGEVKWRLETFSECLLSIVLHLQLFYVIWSSATEETEIILRYYADLTRLDEALDLRKADYYCQERNILNRRFFSLLFFYFLKLICESISFIMSFTFKEVWTFINDYVLNAIQMISQLHYFVRVIIFRTRLATFNEKLETELNLCSQSKLDWNKDRYSKIIMKYKSCYMMLHSLHNIINQSHGIKILLSIACLIVSVVHTIYTILIFVIKQTHNLGIVACLVRTVPDLALFFSLVLYIARITHLRQRLLDILEQLLCAHTLSETEQRSVLSLVELIHRQPLQFTAYGFFTLDLPLLCGILNFVVTYIIILTQMNSPADSLGFDVSTANSV